MIEQFIEWLIRMITKIIAVIMRIFEAAAESGGVS